MLKIFKTLLFCLAVGSICHAGTYTMEFCGKRTRLFRDGREVTFADCIKEQQKRYDKGEVRDLIKQAYQGAYGAGHATVDLKRAWGYFSREFSSVQGENIPLVEIISPDYCRINLAAWKKEGLPPEWLFNMFTASSEIFPDSEELFKKYLALITESFPDRKAGMEKFLTQYRGGAVHHSATYRHAYRPAYRIVSTRFLTILQVLKAAAKLPAKQVYVIAIDGKAASGKTTLSKQLAAVLKAEVIHMDDFFLPRQLRTAERFAEPGGNVHYERFKAEVLPNLRKNKDFSYRKFDCSKMELGGLCHIKAARWRIVEGAYSLHPIFGNYADLKIFFDIDPAEQMKRIKFRNGEKMAKIFAARWIPLEENYIKKLNIQSQADLIL